MQPAEVSTWQFEICHAALHKPRMADHRTQPAGIYVCWENIWQSEVIITSISALNGERPVLVWIMQTVWSQQLSSQLLLNILGHTRWLAGWLAGFQKILEKEIATCAVSTKEEARARREHFGAGGLEVY